MKPKVCIYRKFTLIIIKVGMKTFIVSLKQSLGAKTILAAF